MADADSYILYCCLLFIISIVYSYFMIFLFYNQKIRFQGYENIFKCYLLFFLLLLSRILLLSGISIIFVITVIKNIIVIWHIYCYYSNNCFYFISGVHFYSKGLKPLLLLVISVIITIIITIIIPYREIIDLVFHM